MKRIAWVMTMTAALAVFVSCVGLCTATAAGGLSRLAHGCAITGRIDGGAITGAMAACREAGTSAALAEQRVRELWEEALVRAYDEYDKLDRPGLHHAGGRAAMCAMMTERLRFFRESESDGRAHSAFRFALAELIVQDMAAAVPGVNAVWIFGSVKQYDAGLGSDIDLIIAVDTAANTNAVRAYVASVDAGCVRLFNALMDGTGIRIEKLFDIQGKVFVPAEIAAGAGFAAQVHSRYAPARRLYARTGLTPSVPVLSRGQVDAVNRPALEYYAAA